MTSAHLQEQAKQGNLEAIALLLNRALQPKGMAAKLVAKNDCLRIMVEAEQVPPQQVAAGLQRALTGLKINSIRQLEIYGRQHGQATFSWRKTLALTAPANLSQSDSLNSDRPAPSSPAIQDTSASTPTPNASTQSHSQQVTLVDDFVVSPVSQPNRPQSHKRSPVLVTGLLVCFGVILGGVFGFRTMFPAGSTQFNPTQRVSVDKPDSVEEWIQEGDRQLAAENYPEALSAYEQATQLDPQNAQAWTKRSVPLSRLGRTVEARATIDQALRLDPNLAEGWKDRCRVFQEQQQLQEALSACDRALQIDPNFDKAWLNRGTIFVSLGQFEDAQASFIKATQINPQYAKAWFFQGHVLAAMNRYEEASAAYQKAAEIDPYFGSNNYGMITADRWNWYQQAIDSRDQTLQTKLEQAGALYYRATFQPDPVAIDTLQKAVQINPNDYHAWNDQGSRFEGLEQYDQAISSYDRATQANPNFGWAWYNRGRLLECQGNYSEAISSYDRAIASGSFPAVERAKQDLLHRLGH